MGHGPRAHPTGSSARATRDETVCSVLRQHGPWAGARTWNQTPGRSQRLCTAMADGEEAWAETLRAVCAGCCPVYIHAHDRCSSRTAIPVKGSLYPRQDNIVLFKTKREQDPVIVGVTFARLLIDARGSRTGMICEQAGYDTTTAREEGRMQRRVIGWGFSHSCTTMDDVRG